MSILDGKVTLSNERPGNSSNNNNNGGFKKKSRGNFGNNGGRNRNFSKNNLSFRGSSYLPDDYVPDDENTEVKEEQQDGRVEAILEFCENFSQNIDNYRTLQDIMIDDFPEVVPIIKSYYSIKNTPALQDALNKFIKLICTTQFADTINSVLESGVWTETEVYSKIWDSIGFALSIALETNHTRMHTDAIKKYVCNIIPRLYKPEINDIKNQTGITADLALDLYIAIPVVSTEWSGSNLEAFYGRFLDKLLVHSDDNIDVLNWEVQGILYEKFFGKTKDALKVIGKYLTSKPVESLDGKVMEAVYNDFQKMLYSKLDEYDINDIEYVINFIVKKKQETPDADMLFNSVKASEYENVRKALLSVMDKNPDSMKLLA